MHQKFIIDGKLEAELAEISGRYFKFIDLKTCLSLRKIVQSEKAKKGSDALDFVPLGIIISLDNKERKDEIKAWYDSLVPIKYKDMNDVFIFHTGAFNDLIRWIVSRQNKNMEILSLNAVSINLELARARVLFERAQKSIADLTTMSRIRDIVPPIAFQILPGDRPVTLSQAPREMEVGVNLATIHAIDIFFNKNSKKLSAGSLTVEMRGLESNQTIQSWDLNVARLSNGWTRLYCPPQSVGLIERVLIAVSVKEGDVNVSLAAGLGQSIVSQVNSKFQQNTAFAVRLLAGVDGVQLSKPGLTQACEYETLSERTEASGLSLLQLIMPLQRSASDGQFCWRPDFKGFLLHPSGRTPVMGVIENLQANSLKRVTVRFRLAHADAEPTEFHFWAEALHEKLEGPRTLKPIMAAIINGFGGLKKTPPLSEFESPVSPMNPIEKNIKGVLLAGGQNGQIEFEFEKPFTGNLNLFFGTRNIRDKSHYSWAVFDGVDLEYSAIQKEQ